MEDDSGNNLGGSIDVEYFYNGFPRLKDDSFRIFHLNIQNIKNKLDRIQEIIKKYQPSVMIFSETHLSDEETSFYNFNEFNSYHSVRSGRKGGGVSIYVKKYLQSCLIFENNDGFNNFIGVRIKEIKSNIIGVYRSNNPQNNNSNFFEEFEKILESHKNSIVLGDTNYDLLNKSVTTSLYIDQINMHGFKIMNSINTNFPTRIDKFYDRHSILDHFITDI